MKGTTYTEDEEIYLEYYVYSGDEKSYEPAAAFLGRSIQSVYNKTFSMRQANEQIGYLSQRTFTEKEISFIRENYNKMKVKDIAEKFRRTEGSVRCKIHAMGLRKTKRLADYDQEIRELSAQGYYQAEIARKTGIQRSVLGDYMKRHNIYCSPVPKSLRQKAWREEGKATFIERG